MMTAATPDDPDHDQSAAGESFAGQVRNAVLWRSGSQILAQLVQWSATFLVIRILSPADYGLFAMCQVILTFMAMLNGYGLASGLIQQKEISQREIRQLFGMLVTINLALAAVQVCAAPFVAAYYRHPEIAPILRVQALLYLTTPFIAIALAQLGLVALMQRHVARHDVNFKRRIAKRRIAKRRNGQQARFEIAPARCVFGKRQGVQNRCGLARGGHAFDGAAKKLGSGRGQHVLHFPA